ncbi:SRPBCC domain-containing protein [Kribbella sp. NPDC049227]|uniref:SRPBCC family protein n=1 Tax=Kribbella sp. NPDC049227 TaxID=3364113 RepID=UPI0037103E27
MSEETPRIVVTVAAPAEAVWDALRNKDKIRHWHGWEYEGTQGGLEEEIDLIYFTKVDDSQVGTLILGDGDRFVVEPVEGGSRITLTRSPRGANPDWEAYYDDITEGWTTFLNQLKFALEQHPDDERRTLFYVGTGAASLTGELGIDIRPAGTSYELDLIGEAVKGEVLYTSEHQIGLTVDAWGNGLLVLSYISPGELKPDGSAMAILSLYGDVDRDALDARWKNWWETHYVPASLPGT